MKPILETIFLFLQCDIVVPEIFTIVMHLKKKKNHCHMYM